MPDPRQPRPLQSFNLFGDDVLLMLSRAWAEQTTEQLGTAKECRRRYEAIEATYERVDHDGEITQDVVSSAFRALWTAEALLITSASNLERWMTKLYRARNRRPRTNVEHLRTLRNALEHLHEANIDDDNWVATARTTTAERSGIGALPDAQLSIGLDGDGRIFGVITHDDLTTLVRALLDELDAELRDYAADWIEWQSE
ncbi:hypothetical protein [Microbacterium deminutum]|uniref:CBS domain-containing protein n=1 Tax=Microbacterium deminutum TaxID=344164 RepID=A0ABN2RJS0_9MICO